MKKIICGLLALTMIASFAACGNKQKGNESDNNKKSQTEQNQNNSNATNINPGNNNQNNQNNGDSAPINKVEKYEDHGVSFKVPDEWQDNFIAKYYTHGSGNTEFTTIEFLSRINKNDVKVMTIASFGKTQWENIKKNNKDAEDMKIGTSKDGSKVFTLRIEDQVFESEKDTKTFKTIRDAAEKIRNKIKIIE